MPPGQYETITVHEDVLDELHEYRTEEESYSTAIKRLLGEPDTAGGKPPEERPQEDAGTGGLTGEDAEELFRVLYSLDERLDRLPERAADEVEGRMR